ncbi:MAG: hypothetical protein AVDCRST_MAG93-4976 [uncultured Chloroflexia bacterium]|uniref:Uncharacterized protein n=1 Tax=uncultured Chloroflexia bacterium TaxID=1672391 RepID=A0A6J4KKG9_9CHLR|nr:MAG: hypothetical protein AVDCRST_MAG93-4976 [uncultured Chloroflexia bacterium]
MFLAWNSFSKRWSQPNKRKFDFRLLAQHSEAASGPLRRSQFVQLRLKKLTPT